MSGVSNLQKLLQKRGEVHAAMKELNGKINPDTGRFPADDESKWAQMDGEYRDLSASIERLNEIEERDRQLAAAQFPGQSYSQERQSRSGDYDSAFWNYILRGENNLTTEEKSLLNAGPEKRQRPKIELRGTATQQTGTGSLGGYLLPTDFSSEIEVAMKYYGMMTELCRLLNTDHGRTIQIPTLDDTATTHAVTPETNAVTVADLTFGQQTISAYVYSRMIKVSEQELQDEVVGLTSLIADATAESLARQVNLALTTGTGSGQPQGIITGASVGKTAASATAFTVQEIIDLVHSVDVSYRRSPKVCFQMNDVVASYIRKLVVGSSDNRFLWEPDLKAGGPDRLLGYPVHINNAMESALTTGKKLILFGDHNKYLVRRVNGFVSKRLNELYAENLVVGFLNTVRVDGKMLNNAALKVLQLA